MKGQLLFISFIIFSCKSTRVDEHCLKTQDTIQVISTLVKAEKSNTELLNTYYSKFGIIIPKYYLLEDSLTLDLNSDNFLDKLIVLSPITLEDVNYIDNKIELKPKRIVVEIINCGDYRKIRNIYDNLISNEGGVLSKYNGIFKTNNGFEIRHEAGSRYSWTYSTEFSTQYNDSIFLIKIEKICSFEGNEKKVEYSFKGKSLQEINLNDTIKNNCNCDSIWMNLEKEYEK